MNKMVDPFEFDNNKNRRKLENKGRRSTDNLEVIDTSNILTLEELTELKKLAQMSKVAKIIIGIVIGIVSMFGVSRIFEWIGKYLSANV